MPTQQPGSKARKEHVYFPMLGRVPWFREPFKLVEPVTGSFLKACWAEYLCTLLFLYLAVGSVIFGCSATDVSGGSANGSSGGSTTEPVDCLLSSSRVLAIATSFGLSIFVLVYVAAAFSGGHLNPAVSFGFLLARKISLQRFLCYVISQMVGSITGSALVYATFKTGFAAGKGASNRLLTGLPTSAGWLMESILTFLLVFVVFTATDQARAQSTAHLPILAPAAIGLAVFICHLAAVPIDGCSVNPARSFGPAVIYGDWTHHWIFWVGPFTGAFFAWLVYDFTFRPSQEPINSVDYVYQDGKAVESIRLPGYAGASGLDADQQALREMKEEEEMDSTGQNDLEMGNAKQRKTPARRRDTADELHSINEDPPSWNTAHNHMPNGNGRLRHGELHTLT